MHKYIHIHTDTSFHIYIEKAKKDSSCSLVVIIFEKFSHNYLLHKRRTCELTITFELICMKGEGTILCDR